MEKTRYELILTPVKNSAVHTPTQEDYDQLVRAYELGGMEMGMG